MVKRLLDALMLMMLAPFIAALVLWMAADLLLEHLGRKGETCGPGSLR